MPSAPRSVFLALVLAACASSEPARTATLGGTDASSTTSDGLSLVDTAGPTGVDTTGPAGVDTTGPAGVDAVPPTDATTDLAVPPDLTVPQDTPTLDDAAPDDLLVPPPDTAVPDAGPIDVGPPPPPSEVLVFIRTGDGAFDGTDDPIELCLQKGLCWTLDNAEINDFERARVDAFRVAPNGLKSVNDLTEVTIKNAQKGQNAWMPKCVAVLLDGHLAFCKDGLSVQLGTESDDTGPAWTAPDPHEQSCASCFGGALTHGPMVGIVTTTTATVWVRTAFSAEVVVEASLSSDFKSVLSSTTIVPTPQTDFMATVQLQGLLPGVTYHYRVRFGGQLVTTDPQPTFRTAPETTGTFGIAFGSCAKDDDQPLFAQIEKLGPDLMLMIGDNHYANSNDLDALRYFYRNSRAIPEPRHLFARASTLAIWDDHDYVGNNTLGTAPGKEVALRAFGEAWANPFAGSGGAKGIWFNTTWGGVELFMLDDRYYRGIDGSMLGKTQREWLLERLEKSTATFKLVATGSQWTQYGSSDSWASFDTAREQIFSHLFSKKIGGVVLLSGDIHRAEVRKLVNAGAGTYPLYELTSSPLANTGSTCGASDPERLFCQATDDYFIIVWVDTTKADPTLVAEVRNSKGAVAYTLSTKASELQVK